MAKVLIKQEVVKVKSGRKTITRHRVTLTVPSGSGKSKTGHVEFGTAKEARNVVAQKLNEAAAAGQYPVKVAVLDASGGGFEGVYTADGRMRETKVEAPGGILGPKCSSVPRPRARDTGSAGHKSVTERSEVVRSRDTWAHLFAALKKGEVLIRMKDGRPALARAGAKAKAGWTVAGAEHFDVVASLIIARTDGYKTLGRFSPILVKPSNLPKQATMDVTLKVLGAGSTARKPTKPPQARKPSPQARKPSQRPATTSARRPSVKPPKPEAPRKPSKPKTGVEAYLAKTDNGTDFDKAFAYLSKMIPKVRAGVLNGLQKSKLANSEARRVGKRLKAAFAKEAPVAKPPSARKPSARKPSATRTSASRPSGTARTPSGTVRVSTRKPSAPSARKPSASRTSATRPSGRKPSSGSPRGTMAAAQGSPRKPSPTRMGSGSGSGRRQPAPQAGGGGKLTLADLQRALMDAF